MKNYKCNKIVRAGFIVSVKNEEDEFLVEIEGDNEPHVIESSVIYKENIRSGCYLIDDFNRISVLSKDEFESEYDLESDLQRIDRRRALQKIFHDARNVVMNSYSEGGLWCEAWTDLMRAADLLDAMMARDERDSGEANFYDDLPARSISARIASEASEELSRNRRKALDQLTSSRKGSIRILSSGCTKFVAVNLAGNYIKDPDLTSAVGITKNINDAWRFDSERDCKKVCSKLCDDDFKPKEFIVFDPEVGDTDGDS